MAERCTSAGNETPPHPPSKRYQFEPFSCEEESDFPNEIFPSEDESRDAFYPSEDSNLVSEVDFLAKPSENSPTLMTNLHGPLTKEATELTNIGQLLVSTCCNQLRLRHLTATDIISSKANFVSMTATQQKQYLFEKIKEGSCECDPKSGTVATKIFVAGKEICGTA